MVKGKEIMEMIEKRKENGIKRRYNPSLYIPFTFPVFLLYFTMRNRYKNQEFYEKKCVKHFKYIS